MEVGGAILDAGQKEELLKISPSHGHHLKQLCEATQLTQKDKD